MFVKYNQSSYADSLIREARGLACLKTALDKTQNTYLKIPQVYEVDEQKLRMEKIISVRPTDKHQHQFGLGLAQVHQKKQACYGFDEDNYIGLNPQKNIISNNWGKFFVEQRLQFQIELIKDKRVRESFTSLLDSVKSALEEFLNQYCDFPSLLHGDLWSGNVMFSNEDGAAQVCLIDPAVYYGDREADIAMTEMFGGFSSSFYLAYNSALPLSGIYKEKKVIYNLYHYLNHYNLFGAAYLGECERGFGFLQELFCSP